jgi:hypothetical protein
MKKIITSFIVLFFITQCKPDDDCSDCTHPPNSAPPTDTLFLNPNLKNYFFFGEGSWWVFKRLDTNAIVYDTATLVRKYHDYNSIYSYPIAREIASVTFLHSYYKSLNSNSGYAQIQRSIQNENSEGDNISMSSNGKLLPSLNRFLVYPFDSAYMDTMSFQRTTLLDVSTYTFNNIVFDSTVHFYHGFTNYRHELWMSKDVGLTKYFNAEDSTTWEIVNYEIKP